MTIFRNSDALPLDTTDTMSAPDFPEGVDELLTEYDASQLMAGSDVELLFRQAGDDGFSLVRAWFGPDYVLPRHHHNKDCTYYVVKGEITLGSQVVGAGEGFFVPAGHSYGYRAGPQGVEILEFRHATSFDMHIVDDQKGKWDEIYHVAYSHHDAWEKQKRSRRS
jgi:mannose-6-phosphate isomerase-like protein (cupin superfamily)